MRKIILIFFLFFTLLAHTKLVFSVPFLVDVNPKSGEGGKTNQFFNFTITNIGTANITEVNITVPPGFINTQINFGTTLISEYYDTTDSPSYIKWVNKTPEGLFGNMSSESFWLYVNTPKSIESFNFTLGIKDTDGLSNSTNVTIFLYDITPPSYSENITFPTSPTEYSANKIYWFNISWTDNTAIDKVLFEQNFTTLNSIVENVSLEYSNNVYYFTISDLPAGNYLFKWYANDTNNTFHSTPQFVYNITKASNPIAIIFNSTSNENITVVNDSVLVISASGVGDLALYKDGSSVGIPYTSYFSSTNLYNFTVSANGNQNHTSNSTTYFVMVVPNYTFSYSAPETYASTESSFWINFSSAPGIDNLFLELDGTRYNMGNSSLTYYSYSSVLAAGSHSWRILGNYSNHIFNLTSLNTFTIQKAVPYISLTATPSWNIYLGNQSSVSCSSPNVSVTLYRNGAAVSNPDTQTLPLGAYLYVCNSTGTQNYSSNSVSSYLYITKPAFYVADLLFTKKEELIIVTQNSSNSTIIKVKNTGNLTQNIYFWIENINSSWYSVNATNVSLSYGKEAAFLVNFFVKNVDPKDYNGSFKVNSTQKTITSNFILRVLPSEEFKLNIITSIEEFEKNYSDLTERINGKKEEGYNTTLAEEKLSKFKELLDQAREYINQSNYFQAYELIDDIRGAMARALIEIDSLTELEKTQSESQTWIYIVISIVVGIVCIILAYLFWPTGQTPKVEGISKEGKENFFEKIKRIFKKKQQEKGQQPETKDQKINYF